MAGIRSRGNASTELRILQALRNAKITGWRRHVVIRIPRRVNGKPSALVIRPDFVFRTSQLAVFVDGCFWHSCPQHSTMPKNNRVFWENKLAANKHRDALCNASLKAAGWKVLRLWEHDAKRFPGRCAARVSRRLRPSARAGNKRCVEKDGAIVNAHTK